MNSFVEKYNDRITGVISCFDRMLFKGYLPIGWSDAMEGLLSRQGLLIKDFGKFVEQQSERLKNHAEKLAESLGRPFEAGQCDSQVSVLLLLFSRSGLRTDACSHSVVVSAGHSDLSERP